MPFWLILLLSAGLVVIQNEAMANANPAVARSSDWLVRTWQTDEGLPDNNVMGVAQSADGYLWVATLGGLMRFDGARFEEFFTLHLPEVPSRGGRRILLGRDGRLWLATDRGVLIRVDEKSARVFTAKDGLNSSRVATMAEDHAGELWVICANAIYHIVGDRIIPVGDKEGLPAGAGAWLAADERGEIWFGRGSQLGVIREGRWQSLHDFGAGPLRFFAARSGGMWVSIGSQVLKVEEGSEPKPIARLPDGVVVQVMLEDHNGTVWVGTAADGLWCLRGTELTPVAVSHPEISALMEDREGNLWIGTAGGGLNLLRPRAMEMITTKAGLPFESVRSVCEDEEGWMWAALANGSLARGRGSEWIPVTSTEGWPGGNANCVAPARGGGVWIGTRARGLQRFQDGKTQEWSRREGLGGSSVRSLLSAANGDLWIGGDSPSRLLVMRAGNIHSLPLPTETRSIRALVEGADGAIWAGSSDGQVLRVAGSNVVNAAGAWEKQPLSVRCLHTTVDGSLWIGYAGWGIGRFHDGSYERAGVVEGIYDDFVSQMLADNHGLMWLTGNHGLSQVRLDELVDVVEGNSTHLRSIAFGKNEGLPSMQPASENSPSSWRSADGRLWFATRNGLLVVSPDKIRDNPSPPPVLLTRVKVDDQLIALRDSRSPLRIGVSSNIAELREPGRELELPPSHGKIEFEFTALSLSSPENVHFRHRLKGFDTEWVEIGPQRTAKYPRLPAGHYEFEVTACNEAGVWSETGFHLPLNVRPFFWQTWWFRSGILILFTGIVIGAVRYFSFRRLRRELERLERLAELQRERTRIARDMHDEVGSKLSRLALLSEMATQQPDMSDSLRGETREISETARDTIRSFEEIVWAVNPKNDTLANLMNYLCRFAEEFFEGSATQCVFDVPDEIPAVDLPIGARHHLFLAAKEALNNAFKHAHARQVCVRLTIAGGGFEIALEDDGVGFAQSALAARAGSGNGLENMRERMRQVGGKLVIQDRSGGGSIVRLQLPPGKTP